MPQTCVTVIPLKDKIRETCEFWRKGTCWFTAKQCKKFHTENIPALPTAAVAEDATAGANGAAAKPEPKPKVEAKKSAKAKAG